VEQLAGNPVRLGAKTEVAAGAGAAQVQVTVLEAGFLADFHVLIDLERQRVRGVQNHDFLGHDLDFARGKSGVFVALRSLGYRSDDLKHVFVPEAVEHLFLADHHLGDARRVTQIDECDTTVVTTAGHPASQGYGLSNVLGTKGSEVMCAQHSTPF
jgi:hypothetical protein